MEGSYEVAERHFEEGCVGLINTNGLLHNNTINCYNNYLKALKMGGKENGWKKLKRKIDYIHSSELEMNKENSCLNQIISITRLIKEETDPKIKQNYITELNRLKKQASDDQNVNIFKYTIELLRIYSVNKNMINSEYRRTSLTFWKNIDTENKLKLYEFSRKLLIVESLRNYSDTNYEDIIEDHVVFDFFESEEYQIFMKFLVCIPVEIILALYIKSIMKWLRGKFSSGTVSVTPVKVKTYSTTIKNVYKPTEKEIQENRKKEKSFTFEVAAFKRMFKRKQPEEFEENEEYTNEDIQRRQLIEKIKEDMKKEKREQNEKNRRLRNKKKNYYKKNEIEVVENVKNDENVNDSKEEKVEFEISQQQQKQIQQKQLQQQKQQQQQQQLKIKIQKEKSLEIQKENIDLNKTKNIKKNEKVEKENVIKKGKENKEKTNESKSKITDENKTANKNEYIDNKDENIKEKEDINERENNEIEKENINEEQKNLVDEFNKYLSEIENKKQDLNESNDSTNNNSNNNDNGEEDDEEGDEEGENEELEGITEQPNILSPSSNVSLSVILSSTTDLIIEEDNNNDNDDLSSPQIKTSSNVYRNNSPNYRNYHNNGNYRNNNGYNNYNSYNNKKNILKKIKKNKFKYHEDYVMQQQQQQQQQSPQHPPVPQQPLPYMMNSISPLPYSLYAPQILTAPGIIPLSASLMNGNYPGPINNCNEMRENYSHLVNITFYVYFKPSANEHCEIFFPFVHDPTQDNDNNNHYEFTSVSEESNIYELTLKIPFFDEVEPLVYRYALSVGKDLKNYGVVHKLNLKESDKDLWLETEFVQFEIVRYRKMKQSYRQQFMIDTYYPVSNNNDIEEVYINPEYSKSEILSLLINQIEYYFSEENLEADDYLKSKMDDEGFVELSLLLTFTNVLRFTNDIAILCQSVIMSKQLELKIDDVYELKTSKVRNKKTCLKFLNEKVE